jgi:hypothetical protein
MTNMVMRDVVEEETSSPSQKGPVNGGNGSSEERPLLVAIMGNGGVRMMEIGKHNNPVVRKL